MGPSPEIERRIVSVLFADLVGFTSLSERLDPEDVATIQDAYFAGVRETIGRYGGVLEKFIGDAAMAVFGVPRARDDDAERAVRAGLALLSRIEQVNAQLALDDDPLGIRVGVTTGEVVHAEAGPDVGRVTGDTVNTAARLQAAAEPGSVLVSETTALAVADAIEVDVVVELELKGKTGVTRARRVGAVRPQRSREHAMGRLHAPMLGRDRETAILRSALADARRGESRCVLVVAPPGVGKTRLVEEFTRSAAADDDRPAIARARLRPDALAPFEPVSQLLLSAGGDAGAGLVSRVRAGLEATAASPGRIDVVCEEVTRLVSPTAAGPRRGEPADRESRFGAWLEALTALAGGHTQVLLVEDAHWASADLLAFLGFVAAGGGRLVLVTARPALLDRASEWGATDTGGEPTVIDLRPLASPDAAALVRALVSDALPADLVDLVASRSDGNPLFVEELLRTWVSSGLLGESGAAGWRLLRPASEVPLPATVQAVYASQIDDLPPDARRVARHAAVAGRRFPAAALAALDAGDHDEGLAALARRGLVEGPHEDRLLGPTYVFRHALLRDAGYATLARADRVRLHVQLARWLEAAAGERVAEAAELVGRHLARAIDSMPALAHDLVPGLDRDEASRSAAAWFERAAEHSLELAAHDAAGALFRRSIGLTAETAVLDLARRWQRLGEATAVSGDMDEGIRALETALGLYRSLDAISDAEAAAGEHARRGRATAAAALAFLLHQQTRFDEASALAEAVLGELGTSEDTGTGEILLARAIVASAQTDDESQPRADAERALAIARSHGDRRLELRALQLLATVGDVTEEMERAWENVEWLARDLSAWQAVVESLRVRAVLSIARVPDAAPPLLDAAEEIADARALNEARAWIDYARTEAGLVAGSWDSAIDSAHRAIERAEANAYHRAAVRTWFTVVPIAVERGATDLLEHAFRWWRQRDARGPIPTSPYARLMRDAMELSFARAGLSPAHAPEVEQRLASFDTPQDHLPSWIVACEIVLGSWLRMGETTAVSEALRRTAAGRAEESPLASASDSLVRAHLLRATGADAGGAAASARIALAHARTAAAPWWIARSIRMLEEIGEADVTLRGEALTIEERLGIRGRVRLA